MNQVHLDETDEAFIARDRLVFYLDEDRTRTWTESPRMIMRWEDVFYAFISDKHGPKGAVARLIMRVLMLDVDDAGRIPIDVENLKTGTAIKSTKTIENALLMLEKNGWIHRGDGREGWLEPWLVERAKRIYRKLAQDAGYDADANARENSAQFSDSVTLRQTSIASAEPRRTLEARTFFVCLDKTS